MTAEAHLRERDDAPITTAKDKKPNRVLFAEAVTINRSAQELYGFWRNLGNLARFMENVVSVETQGDTRSHWVVKAPAGRHVEWDADIISDVPGSEISWQSVEGADVRNSGRVQFTDAGARGTIVRATIAYDPPGGTVGKLIAKLFQREPRIQTRRDLRRFKQLMETGEVATAARTRKQLDEEKD